MSQVYGPTPLWHWAYTLSGLLVYYDVTVYCQGRTWHWDTKEPDR